MAERRVGPSETVESRFRHTYDAILAAPVDTEELVTAEALWISARVGVYGTVPMLVAMIFGLWELAMLGHVAFLVGFALLGGGWRFGIWSGG